MEGVWAGKRFPRRSLESLTMNLLATLMKEIEVEVELEKRLNW